MKPYAAIAIVICGFDSVKSEPRAEPGMKRPAMTATSTASAPAIEPT